MRVGEQESPPSPRPHPALSPKRGMRFANRVVACRGVSLGRWLRAEGRESDGIKSKSKNRSKSRIRIKSRVKSKSKR